MARLRAALVAARRALWSRLAAAAASAPAPPTTRAGRRCSPASAGAGRLGRGPGSSAHTRLGRRTRPSPPATARRRIGTGAYAVGARRRTRARRGAAAQRACSVYAEPDRYATRTQAPAPDPLVTPRRPGAPRIVDPSLVPPPVTDTSPLLALIDSTANVSHPEFAGGHVSTLGGFPILSAHGTETAAVAAAPKNDRGILGVWPGMRALNVSLPEKIRCRDSVTGIARAIERGASVINMSYGATAPCFAEYVELQVATGKGLTLVAAAGNELAEGNPLLFPASLPRADRGRGRQRLQAAVLLERQRRGRPVGARCEGITDRRRRRSSTSDGAPTATRPSAARSFSAPMVAAAAVRGCAPPSPSYRADQVAQVLRNSARDLERKGWDSATGYGLLDLLKALSAPAPAVDPHEPNDDMAWINGEATGRIDSPIWRRGGARKLRALVDKYEDPSDVYKIEFPPRARVRVTLYSPLRQSGSRRLHPQRDLDGRRRAADRALAPHGQAQGHADAAQPVAPQAVGLHRRLHRPAHPHARLALRAARPEGQALTR